MSRATRLRAGLLAGALALPLIAAHEGIETRDVIMNGALEVGTEGDRAGQAVAHVSIPEDDGTAICLELDLRKPLSADAGAAGGLHIHLGSRNEAGPVTVDLTELIGDFDETGTIDGCIDDPVGPNGAVPGPVLADIVLEGRERFTNDYYLNLHTENFPAGALRGQITGENYRPDDRPAPAANRPSRG